MDKSFYFESLYPFQDDVLKLVSEIDTGLYLTGGTAASRAYLNHRFSDDLDFFTNDSPDFELWAGRLIQVLPKIGSWYGGSRRHQFISDLAKLGEGSSLSEGVWKVRTRRTSPPGHKCQG